MDSVAQPIGNNIKRCSSAPACAVHKCRHAPYKCPDPQKCFEATRKQAKRCPSAMAAITPRGTHCTCSVVGAKYDRLSKRGAKRRLRQPYKKQVRSMYKNHRTTFDKWYPKKSCCKKCCEIL